MDPKISIILPSYNYAHLMVEALASIDRQTETSWELLAVEDGSTDGSLEVLNRFAEGREGRVKVLTHPGRQNQGLTKSVALALERCRGDFVAFLDADDVLYPESFSRRLEKMEKNPDLVLSHHGVVLDGPFWQVRERVRELSKIRFPQPGIYEALPFLLRSNVALTLSGVLVRRSALKTVRLDSPVDPWLDWWILTQLSLAGPFYLIAEKLMRWRIHDRSYNFLYCSRDDAYERMLDFMKQQRARVSRIMAEEKIPALTPGRRIRSKRALWAAQREAAAPRMHFMGLVRKVVPAHTRRAIKRILVP